MRKQLPTGRAWRLAALGLLSLLAVASVAYGSVVEGGHFRVTFTGTMTPRTLPRHGLQPVYLSVRGSVKRLGNQRPPALHRFTVAFNRHAKVSMVGLPSCPLRRLKAMTTEQALSHCRSSLVGTGRFRAHIDIPEDSPFPAAGPVLAFKTMVDGRPALVGHVYGPRPVPTTAVLPLLLRRAHHGTFGILISATMPDVGNEWGYVTGFALTLGRTYTYRGRPRTFLSAGCPAPPGFSSANFKLARGTFYLADGRVRSRVLNGSCRVDARGIIPAHR